MQKQRKQMVKIDETKVSIRNPQSFLNIPFSLALSVESIELCKELLLRFFQKNEMKDNGWKNLPLNVLAIKFGRDQTNGLLALITNKFFCKK